MEFNQETSEKNGEEGSKSQQMKQWFQDNLRIIVSILVVVLIAGGIYSYSNRSQAPSNKDQQEQSDVLSQATSGDSNNSASATDDQTQQGSATDQSASQVNQQKAQPTVAQGTSKETDTSFVETAGKGDGTTKLARRALADYLEKNPDSALTAEHKIFIEDFLRKNIGAKSVKVGASVEFSKSLINDAISKSKNLNDKQLKNLHKYAVRVHSLS